MVRVLLLVFVVLFLIGAKPSNSNYQPVSHNSDNRVEQQYGLPTNVNLGCSLDGDLSDCVTNQTDCFWDVDDFQNAVPETCLIADWGAHLWVFSTCNHKRFDPTVTIMFPHQNRSFSFTQTDSITWMNGKNTECFRSCVFGPSYSRESPELQLIPLMGGQGQEQGWGVPSTVSIKIEEAGRKAVIGVSGRLGNSFEIDNWCPSGFPLGTSCDPIGTLPRFCR